MSRWTAFLVFSCFSRPLCSRYWQVRRGRQFSPMFPLCFSQIQSSSSWSGERSCGNPDLLTISSYSCTVPLSWPKWHACRRSYDITSTLWKLYQPHWRLTTEWSLSGFEKARACHTTLASLPEKIMGQRVHPQWLTRTSVMRDSSIVQL